MFKFSIFKMSQIWQTFNLWKSRQKADRGPVQYTVAMKSLNLVAALKYLSEKLINNLPCTLQAIFAATRK